MKCCEYGSRVLTEWESIINIYGGLAPALLAKALRLVPLASARSIGIAETKYILFPDKKS
jgi:hypothetical protein